MCLPGLLLSGQQKLQGVVRDPAGKAVPGASISLLKKQTAIVLAYAICDQSGYYQLIIPAAPDTLQLKVTAMGFKPVLQLVIPGSPEPVNITLTPSAMKLPEVSVNNVPKLKQAGDTLNYDVSAFQEKQDRVIGDVIRRLPGIEVQADGRILYNGKAISNYYIDGDDLLDDRYNLANNAIPADLVDKVQVLENHQPIRALKGKAVSDRAALNIKLKDAARTRIIGDATAGAGAPYWYDESLNLMLFRKKVKMLAALKANNNGNDLAQELTSHNLNDFIRQVEMDPLNALLSPNTLTPPPVAKQDYLFNQSLLSSNNLLFNLGKDWQVKCNLNYLYNDLDQHQHKTTNIFAPADTITYTERQDAGQYIHQFQPNVQVIHNGAKQYMKNNMALVTANDHTNTLTALNNDVLTQRYGQHPLAISNEFNWVSTLRNNQTVELYSYINYSKGNETLEVRPGRYENLLNEGVAYDGLRQHTNVPSWFINTYGNYQWRLSPRLLQTFKAGHIFRRQQLNSALLLIDENMIKPAADSFSNALEWTRNKSYAEVSTEWQLERWNFRLNLPLSFNVITYEDGGLVPRVQEKMVFFTPYFNMRYKLGKESLLSATYTAGNETGIYSDVYGGYILQDYRSIRSQSGLLPRTYSHTGTVGFSFKRVIRMFFANVNMSYRYQERNVLLVSHITPALQQSMRIPFTNDNRTWLIMSGLSKYWFGIKSTTALKLFYQYNRNYQVQNNDLLHNRNHSYSINASARPKINSWLDVGYEANYVVSSTRSTSDKLSTAARRQSLQWTQSGFVQFWLWEKISINMSGDYYHNRLDGQAPQRTFLAGSKLACILPAGTALSLECSNLFNTGSYILTSVADNIVMQTAYRLRGRNVMAKVSFRF